jgi:hypothetical protein
MHYWLHTLRLDLLPPSVLSKLLRGTLVFDTGLYSSPQPKPSNEPSKTPTFSG